MTLKVKLNNLHFPYQLWESQGEYLVQIWWLQLKSITGYRMDKLDF